MRTQKSPNGTFTSVFEDCPNPYIGMSYGTGLLTLVERYAAREALVFDTQRYTFRDVKQQIDRASARFAGLGLQRGDKVSIWLPNRPEFIWYWLGAVQIGVIPVLMNTRLKPEEAAYQIDQSDSLAVLVPGDGAFRDFLGDVLARCTHLTGGAISDGLGARLPKLRHVIALDAHSSRSKGIIDWSEPADSNLPMPPLEVDQKAPSFIAYSSGTTALPKGVVLNQMGLRKAWDHGERYRQTADDRFFMVVPLFGILANVNGILSAWSRGSCVVLESRFDPDRAIELIERERCTVAYLFPIMVEKILNHPEYRPERVATLRTGSVVGNDPLVLRRIAEDMNINEYTTSYGMTETSSVCTRSYGTDPIEIRETTHGTALPGIEVQVRDVETGAILDFETEGEICVRGYNVMIGYYKKPQETAAAFTADRFFRTGDLGYITLQNRLVFLRRIKDGYKHKGFNVSTTEVEKAIAEYPGVAEAAVVGLPDRLLGDVGAAFVVPRSGTNIDPAQLVAFLEPRLASYKLPGHIFVVPKFPVTAGTGKVQKFKLREMAFELLQKEPKSCTN